MLRLAFSLVDGRRFGRRLFRGDLPNKPVSAPGKSLNEPRIARGISQRLANLVDGCVEPMFEVDERVRWPEALAKLFARDQVSRTSKQRRQNLERFLLELQPMTLPSQLSAAKVSFVVA